MVFLRSIGPADDFEAAFENAAVELIEFEEFNEYNTEETAGIWEIPSHCICYNPICPKRRYKDVEGRIYAQCTPEDMAGEFTEQMRHFTDTALKAALADIKKYICENGYITMSCDPITFEDAPEWWQKECCQYILEYFEEE